MTAESIEIMTAGSVNSMDVALYMSAVEGQIEKFRDHQGSLQSLCTTNRDTVLHVHVAASTHGAERFIKFVLEKCPSLLHQPNAKGQTPLHVVAKKKDDGMVKFLINQAMAQSSKDPESNVEDGGREAARKMLRAKDIEMNTALHLAVRFGHLPVVKALLELEDPGFCYGANISQETPLYMAAALGKSLVVVEILAKFHSEATYGGPHGRTALHVATMKRDEEITRIIAEKRLGNYMTLERDENGHTPLHYAAHLGHLPVVRVLLNCDNQCAAAYIGDKKREMTPLLVAARQGHVEIVSEILQRCPNCLGKVDKRGWNVAHFLVVRRVGIDLVTKNPVRNLIDEEDALGISPRQLVDSILDDVDQRQKDRHKELLIDVFGDQVAGRGVRFLVVNNHPLLKFSESNIEKAWETRLLVATLVATVAFAAGITVPGGYRSENGPQHKQAAGTPFLLHSAAFQAFVISDTLAFVWSLYTIFSFYKMKYFSLGEQQFIPGDTSLGFALIALNISFSTAFYVVLKPTPVLAFASCFIGLSYFLLHYAFAFTDYSIFYTKRIIFCLVFYFRTGDCKDQHSIS